MTAPRKSIRIGVGQFAHETCTFCPTPTGIAEWEFYGPPIRGDAVLTLRVYDPRGKENKAVVKFKQGAQSVVRTTSADGSESWLFIVTVTW